MLPYYTTKSYDGLDHESNFKVYENLVECTANALQNGVPPLENPVINISQSVDDYSLYYILSTGNRYCASLKKSGEGYNTTQTGKGNLSNNQVKPIHQVFTSPNEFGGDGYSRGIGKSRLGEHYETPLQHYHSISHGSSNYPGISRYVENLQTFLQGARPQKKGKTVGFKCKEEPAWDIDMESTKFQCKSSTKNFLPSYCEEKLKELSKDEYWTALRCESKDISKGSSSHHGVSRFSTKKSDEEKWKAILWIAQDGKEPVQASNIPTTRLSGTGKEKEMQTNDNVGTQQVGQNQINQFYVNNNCTRQAPEKNSSSSSQFSKGYQISEFQTKPSFTHGDGSGMEKCSKDVTTKAKESFINLDDEEDIISRIWEIGHFPSLGDDDCYILPVSQNKDFQIHDQSKSYINQVIDTRCFFKGTRNSSGGSNQGFASSGKLNQDSTIIETAKVTTTEGLLEQEDSSVKLKFPEFEGLDIFEQDQDELNFGSDVCTNDELLFSADHFGDDK